MILDVSSRCWLEMEASHGISGLPGSEDFAQGDCRQCSRSGSTSWCGGKVRRRACRAPSVGIDVWTPDEVRAPMPCPRGGDRRSGRIEDAPRGGGGDRRTITLAELQALVRERRPVGRPARCGGSSIAMGSATEKNRERVRRAGRPDVAARRLAWLQVQRDLRSPPTGHRAGRRLDQDGPTSGPLDAWPTCRPRSTWTHVATKNLRPPVYAGVALTSADAPGRADEWGPPPSRAGPRSHPGTG